MTPRHSRMVLAVLGIVLALPAGAATSSLIVVQDRGGISALPYYQALNLQPRSDETPVVPPAVPAAPNAASGNAPGFPVRSLLLTPGAVQRRVIQAPGLSPIFLVGDDAPSRAWLHQHIDALRKLNAIGLIVNIDSANALAGLRRRTPGLSLVALSGDDLARRLGLSHYPVLITATGIEQ